MYTFLDFVKHLQDICILKYIRDSCLIENYCDRNVCRSFIKYLVSVRTRVNVDKSIVISLIFSAEWKFNYLHSMPFWETCSRVSTAVCSENKPRPREHATRDFYLRLRIWKIVTWCSSIKCSNVVYAISIRNVIKWKRKCTSHTHQ